MSHSAWRLEVDQEQRWRKRFLASITGLALILLTATGQPSAQSKITPLAEMVSTAGTIVSGKVTEVRAGVHPDYPNVEVTFVTLHVNDSFKGTVAPSSTMTFMQFGGAGPTRIRELPSYGKGEDVMIFLYPESRYGFTSPVGGEQGRFRFIASSEGRQRISNGNGNFGLFCDVTSSPLGLSETEKKTIGQARGAVDYASFGSIVRKLVGRPTH